MHLFESEVSADGESLFGVFFTQDGTNCRTIFSTAFQFKKKKKKESKDIQKSTDHYYFLLLFHNLAMSFGVALSCY